MRCRWSFRGFDVERNVVGQRGLHQRPGGRVPFLPRGHQLDCPRVVAQRFLIGVLGACFVARLDEERNGAIVAPRSIEMVGEQSVDFLQPAHVLRLQRLGQFPVQP